MSSAPTHAVPPCALCGVHRKLELSHIIPQFVYRWAQATANGKEILSGPTRPLLCGHCEDLFSSYESEFARHVFHPVVAGSILTAKYGAWLRKFATSVCWRILAEDRVKEAPGHFDGRWAAELASCRETWRQYLRGHRPDVGAHHLHLVCLELNPPTPALYATPLQRGIKPSLTKIPSREGCPSGRGVLGCNIAMEVVCLDQAAFIYAELGPIILLGLIADPDPRPWRGTRINAEGKLKPRERLVPAPYRDYLLSRERPT